MKVLIIGGTGTISRGIVRGLLARGAEVTLYNRGSRPNPFSEHTRSIVGDRADAANFESTFASAQYDVVIDMLCFVPEDASRLVRVFGGRCQQVIMCSSVCAYGVETPPRILVDEAVDPTPISEYGRNKLRCERILQRASARGRFEVTVVRPSHTYGPEGPLLDQVDLAGRAWDRVRRGFPVLCAGDGLGLWQATHRDDCGAFFAHAALAPRTYGEAYNATTDEIMTWREYYRRGAASLNACANLVFVPAGWLLAQASGERLAFFRETSQFHGAYSSAKARAHVPRFAPSITFDEGARETLESMRARDAWPNSLEDREYQSWVDSALKLGFPVVQA